MEGTCPCGGRLKERNHTVTTQKGADEWVQGVKQLPMTIEQTECQSCGRYRVRCIDRVGNIVYQAG